MEHFNWKFENKPLEIVALGDIHLGSSHCEVEFLKSIVKKIKRKKCKVILLGDLLDCGLKESPGASVYEQSMSPKQQIEEIVKILKPIAPQILSSNIGNHCMRITNSTSLDVMQIICDNLKINNGKYQTINTIQCGKEIYQIFSIHGHSNAMTTEGRINAFKKYMDIVECDITLGGHCHDLAHRVWSKRMVTPNGIMQKDTHLVLCGNMLGYENSYAEYQGLPLLECGCPLIKIFPNSHKIEVDLEWFK